MQRIGNQAQARNPAQSPLPPIVLKEFFIQKKAPLNPPALDLGPSSPSSTLRTITEQGRTCVITPRTKV